MNKSEIRKEIVALVNKGDWIIVNGVKKTMTLDNATKIVCKKYGASPHDVKNLLSNDGKAENVGDKAITIEQIRGNWYICEKHLATFKLLVISKGFKTKELAHQSYTRKIVLTGVSTQHKENVEKVEAMYE
ncbi:MAG: hypothetical protein ACRBG0_27625 [Lewinella sp.]|uniref:hypothetical protein n=1 Tax=Lewinella sp. TaxID=2004506 RepID=UPI003D6A76EC